MDDDCELTYMVEAISAGAEMVPRIVAGLVLAGAIAFGAYFLFFAD